MIWCLYSFVWFVWIKLLWTLEDRSPEFKLIRQLFDKDRYDPSVRPRFDPSDPIDMSIHLELTKLKDVSEKYGYMLTSGSLQLQWSDEFLTWNASEYNNLTSVIVPGDNIWVPNTGILNEFSKGYIGTNHLKGLFVKLEWDGTVTIFQVGEFQTSCYADLFFFPFDKRDCMISITNWNYNSDKIVLKFHPEQNETSMLKESGEWILLNTKYKIEKDYQTLSFVFTLERRWIFQLFNNVIPAMLHSVLALIGYCVPPGSGERISLSISTFLAFVVFLNQLTSIIPENSITLPLINIYVILLLILTMLSVVSSVIAVYFHHLAKDLDVSDVIAFCCIDKSKVFPLPLEISSDIDSSKSAEIQRINELYVNQQLQKRKRQYRAYAKNFDRTIFCFSFLLILAANTMILFQLIF